MASSPVKFFSVFLIVSVVGWVAFTFAARLLAWFLSRIMSASVVFRVAGWNRLRDVTIKFTKGSIESVSIGEVKLSFRKSLVKLGFGVISKDPKLQLLICDLEVVVRPSEQNKSTRKGNKHRSTGKGKWFVITSMARFLSVEVADLAIKVPRAFSCEVKELTLDIFKTSGPNQILVVKLQVVPLVLHLGEPGNLIDHANLNQLECSQVEGTSSSMTEKCLAPSICESIVLTCEFGHQRDRGVKVVNLDLVCGDVYVNINEKSFSKKGTGKEIDPDGSDIYTLTSTVATTKGPRKNNSALSSMKKQILIFPEKVSFTAPKLDVKFMHLGKGLAINNNVMGIRVTSDKPPPPQHIDSQCSSTHLDIHIDLTEIHLFREETGSILEVQRVAAIASVVVPSEITLPVRVEIDVKLGGTQCNFIVSRLMPLLQLPPSKRKAMTVEKENFTEKMSKPRDSRTLMWTCTVSAPEMAVLLYNFDGVILYRGTSESSHLFANNMTAKGIRIHTELGEIQLHMEDEYQEFLKDNVFGVDTYSGSLVHISRLSLDLGNKEVELPEIPKSSGLSQMFSVDVSGIDVQFGLKHVEFFLYSLVCFRNKIKAITASNMRLKENVANASKKKSKGVQMLSLNVEKCSISYTGSMTVENTVVADPKRVNFGSHGGDVIISTCSDGTQRNAIVSAMLPGGAKSLNFSTSLVISQLTMCINKEKESMQTELERAKLVYKEHPEEQHLSSRVTLFDLQNAKIVRQAGGLSDISICSLFSATDIAMRWEPDAYLAFYESYMHLKFLFGCSKYEVPGSGLDSGKKTVREENGSTSHVSFEKRNSRKDSIVAFDVETLRITAALADGVEADLFVQSIFTENAKIGVLLEGLVLSFNNARFFRSSRLQVSCIPVSSKNLVDVVDEPPAKRDWVIQGLDVHICMPFRLPLRAIQDATEDMLRALKLIIAATISTLYPARESTKKKRQTSNFGSIRFVIRKLTAEIEEEPIQGWLDEHYRMMRNERCELAVRMKFLDELSSAGSKNLENTEMKDLNSEDDIKKQQLQDINEKIFRSYYLACQKIEHAEGSGACANGFQSGFRPSCRRASLLSVMAAELDVSLTRIDGSDSGMIEFIKKVDPVCRDNNIPFSRLYGRNIDIHAGSLVVQLRDYTFPLFSATSGRCQGCVVLAQQATCFQPQIHQDVYVGRWRKVRMLRSASGTTPAMKMYSNLPIHFNRGQVSFGVGFEPAFADVSYAFQIALKRVNLSTRNVPSGVHPPKKERSLPWWDDMRYYIHGKIVLYFNETTWNILATENPYEDMDKFQIVSNYMEVQKIDGHLDFSAKEFKIYISSLERLMKNCSLKVPSGVQRPFIYAPSFSLNVSIDWECESGNPRNHYLHAVPDEGDVRKKVLDPFRSTSLSLRFNFSLMPSHDLCNSSVASVCFADNMVLDGTVYNSSHRLQNEESPTMNLGAHDLAWVFSWWDINYSPPFKLRSFSKWPRFGIPRAARSGNLSLDKVLTELLLRVDATPCCIRHMPLGNDDPASGLTFNMSKLKYELCYSRGKQKFTFDCKRESLSLVYRGLDLHLPKVYLVRESNSSSYQDVWSTKGSNNKGCHISTFLERQQDDGFLLCSDFFTIRRQSPKADSARLLAWQEAGRKNIERTYVKSEFEHGSGSDHMWSDPSDDDGFNVVIADNCQRVFVYGLKLLWTIGNRDAVWSWVGGMSKAFETPKPSPSRQFAQRKMMEEKHKQNTLKVPDVVDGAASTSDVGPSISKQLEVSVALPATSSEKENCSSSDRAGSAKQGDFDSTDEEGTQHFMVNVVQPQFNLHSEEANGRFLLAAASGRVIARSFNSVLHVGSDLLEKALGTQFVGSQPEMTWKRAELSVMLEQVQAHVAPTDIDPGAGLQWLPKILRSSEKLKRTGALLERVFMPCQMYFRYTRHKGGTPELKVKPLKELSFNSPNITATMTSRQFQVMLDVLSNLLFARPPKPRKSSLLYPSDDDEDIEEEADEVVPDGVEEVEFAKINVERNERERKLLLNDIRTLLRRGETFSDQLPSENDNGPWAVHGGNQLLVQGLKKELENIQKAKKAASAALRKALQGAAHTRLMEKEKNKSPSYAMRISMQMNKVVWSMLADGKTFAETEINDMIYDFDRDYKDIGVARFTTKFFVVRNCLPNSKSPNQVPLLSAWNAPREWGRNVMLRVDAKQGAPKDGSSPLELFLVEIYPLKIYLTETMYRMMWEYFFPEEELDSQKRQEVWRVSTSAGSRKLRKSYNSMEASTSSTSCSNLAKESEVPPRISASTSTSTSTSTHSFSRQAATYGDISQGSKLQSLKANMVCGSNAELRKTMLNDQTKEENAAESSSNQPSSQVHSAYTYSKNEPVNLAIENPQAVNELVKNKPRDSKLKPGRLSHEERKISKPHDEKRARSRKQMEFHNIKISQVELLVTYEGSRFAVNDLRLLMDTFDREEFTGTWRRLFSRVKKHIIWGVLKSVTGMQGKKFKDKAHNQQESFDGMLPGTDLNFSDSDGGQTGKSDQFPVSWLKRPSDGSGDSFVTSIKGLFNSQRRKAKAFMRRTMRGDADNEFHEEWSGSDAESSHFARQLSITNAKKYLRRHTKKFRPRGQKSSGVTLQLESSSPPHETSPFQSDSSDASSYEDFHD